MIVQMTGEHSTHQAYVHVAKIDISFLASYRYIICDRPWGKVPKVEKIELRYSLNIHHTLARKIFFQDMPSISTVDLFRGKYTTKECSGYLK